MARASVASLLTALNRLHRHACDEHGPGPMVIDLDTGGLTCTLCDPAPEHPGADARAEVAR
jgi:hypothetical protein